MARFTTQTRSPWKVETFNTLAEAIAFGRTLRVPFDVSLPSGAFIWVWEMREEAVS